MTRQVGGTPRALHSVLWVGAALALPTHASGQAPAFHAPAYSASAYSAPPECPDRAAWLGALRQRLAERPTEALLARALEVRIERADLQGSTSSYSGEVRASDARRELDGRSVRGSTCREVFEALTLIAALSLEPQSVSSEDVHTSASPSWTLTAEDELSLSVDSAPPSVAPRRDGARFGAAVLAVWGGAATSTFDLDLGAALTARWTTPDWQPLLMLGFYTGGERVDVRGTAANARLERLAAHAVACPLRFPPQSVIALRPCLDLDVGQLAGTGVDVYGATRRAAPWVSAGAELRAEWSPWEAVELGAMVGGVVALTRPRFYFVPGTTAFEADAAALRAGASASMSF